MGAGAEDDRIASEAGWNNAEEHPQHPVTLPAYWIQRTEVTNAQYGCCVEAGGCEPPDDGNIRYRNPQFAKQPVTGITWFQARDYAAWAGRPAAHGGGVGEGVSGRLGDSRRSVGRLGANKE